MAKKLIPQKVTNIGVHKDTYSCRSGKSEFTHRNYVVNMDIVENVLDMKNKIVLKSLVLYERLEEGRVYDLLISQDMKDYDTGIIESQKRERIGMKLSKIEIPSNDVNFGLVTYVFEKYEYVSDYDKKKKLEEQQDMVKQLADMVVEMLKLERKQQIEIVNGDA